MSRLAMVLATAATVGACQAAGSSPTPAATASPPPSAASSAATPRSSEATSAREIPASGRLDPGVYTRSSFQPHITFAVEEGWSVGSVTTGFFDIQQQRGTPDVIAVQFANVEGVVSEGGQTVSATSAADAAPAIAQNPGLTVVGESDSRLGGLMGFTIEVENAGTAHVGILDVPPGRLGIDPERRLWVSVYDTAHGVLAVMVGGSTDDWDRALLMAEPVLEGIVIG